MAGRGRNRLACAIVLCTLSALAAAEARVEAAAVPSSSVEVAAARALFEANLQAIRDRDADAYLDCYLESETLVRNGPEGISLGFESLAASTGSEWPDLFEARDLELVPVRPGVVYGSYRYRVRYGSVEQTGRSERVFVATEGGWKIAVTTAFGTPDAAPPPIALVGATLVDGRGGAPVVESTVVVRDGEIECAGSAHQCEIPIDAERLELPGRWITPGLIDAHVHFSQTGWIDGRPDFLDLRAVYPYEGAVAAARSSVPETLRSYLCSGVTAVFDVGGYPWTWDLRTDLGVDPGVDLSAAPVGGPAGATPHVAAVGPLLSTIPFWVNLPAEAQFLHLADEATARQQVRYLASRGTDAVKIWFIAEEPGDVERFAPVVRAAGAEAAALGLRMIAHATALAAAKVAVEAGADLLVHSVWDTAVDDDFVTLLLDRGTTYCPTLTVTAGYERLVEAIRHERAPSIDDPNGCIDASTRRKVEATAEVGRGHFDPQAEPGRLPWIVEREGLAADNLERLASAGVPIALGTDAGNPLTLHGTSIYAELEAMQAAGLAPAAVLRAATLGSATAMGRGEKLGALAPGRAADLLVLTADPLRDIANMRRLEFVMLGGELRSIGELRAPGAVTRP